MLPSNAESQGLPCAEARTSLQDEDEQDQQDEEEEPPEEEDQDDKVGT